jgi:hypothetical protein
MMCRSMFIVASLVGLAVAASPAAARQPQTSGTGLVRPVPAQPVPQPAGTSRPLKDRQCLHDCQQTMRSCVSAAQVDFRMCQESTCAGEIDAFNRACAADRTSDACRAARRALHDCALGCRADYRTALQSCRATARECSAGCPERQPSPPPKDPACIGLCRSDHSDCLAAVRQKARDCRNQCSPIAEAARAACADDARTSEECRAFRFEFNTCVQQCDRTLRTGEHDCTTTATECVRSCPNRDPA